MKKENWFCKLLRKLHIIYDMDLNQSWAKEEMCRRAKKSGICDNKCDFCAWKTESNEGRMNND